MRPSLLAPLGLLVGACTANPIELLSPLDAAVVSSDFAKAACNVPGLPIHLGDTTENADCAGTFAAQVGRYALCSCLDITTTANLSTDSIDSSTRPMMGMMMPPMPKEAFVGSDGNFITTGSVNLGGGLAAGGAVNLSFNHLNTIAESLWSGGDLTASGSSTVFGDAHVNGDVLGNVNVKGNIYVPMGKMVPFNEPMGKVKIGPVPVTTPCNCMEGSVIDVKALTDAHSQVNDNAAQSFDPNVLADITSSTTVDLPCSGEFFAPSIVSVGFASLTLHVHGRSALYVGGDVTLAGDLNVILDDSAELDLVVEGDFTSRGSIGASASPSRVRLWIGGNNIQLSGDDLRINIDALVYAPIATLSVLEAVSLSATGSLVVDSLSLPPGVQTIHLTYDRALLSAGAECMEPNQNPPQ